MYEAARSLGTGFKLFCSADIHTGDSRVQQERSPQACGYRLHARRLQNALESIPVQGDGILHVMAWQRRKPLAAFSMDMRTQLPHGEPFFRKRREGFVLLSAFLSR